MIAIIKELRFLLTAINCFKLKFVYNLNLADFGVSLVCNYLNPCFRGKVYDFIEISNPIFDNILPLHSM